MGLGILSPHATSPVICVLWAGASSTWRCNPACSSLLSTQRRAAEHTKQCSTSSSSAPTSPPCRTGLCGCEWPSLRRGLLPHRALRWCCWRTTTACGSLRAARSTASCGPSYGSAGFRLRGASVANAPWTRSGTASPLLLSWLPPWLPCSDSCDSTTRRRPVDARTMTALPRHWFRGTSVPTLTAYEFLERWSLCSLCSLLTTNTTGHLSRHRPPIRFIPVALL